MSSLIQAPPPSIQIGGAGRLGQHGMPAPDASTNAGPGGDPIPLGPGGPGGPGGAPGQNRPPGGPGAGATAFVAALKKLAADTQAAIDTSDDPIDKSELAGIAASIHKMIAGEQQETDKMMGGGISPRAIRRGGSASASAGPGY